MNKNIINKGESIIRRNRKQIRRNSLAWKRFIETMLVQLPKYIDSYPPNEKSLLEEFFQVLKAYQVDTQDSREKFSEFVMNFTKKYRPTEIYLRLPFMWFAIQYLENANRLLHTSSFFAEEFYEYLAEHFRGSSGKRGLFHLIREKIPLNAMDWEELQYTLGKLASPLTSEQSHILSLVISSLSEPNTLSLNKMSLSSFIRKNTKIKYKNQDLNQFFNLIDARWTIQFDLETLGLERIICKFQIFGKTSLQEIIDFSNYKLYITLASQIYRLKTSPNTFIGVLIGPKDFYKYLLSHLKRLEQSKIISLREFSIIRKSKRSTSFVQYKDNQGWLSISPTRKKNLIQRLMTKQPRRRRIVLTKMFFSETQTLIRDDFKTKDIYEIVSLFCKLNGYFTFEELTFGLNSEKRVFNLSKREEGLLSMLLRDNNVSVSFLSNQLRLDFSIDEYWVKIPHIPIGQLTHLLEWLPYSSIEVTEDSYHLRTVLTSKLEEIIQKHLKWEIFPIIEEYHPLKVEIGWFDKLRNQWNSPEFKI